MEAQPQPPTPSTGPPLSAVAPPPPHLNYPDSVDSSPRSRNNDSWDEPFPPATSKLRLMCSYGGHIVPRPTDKALCYVGGDTRIVVVERATSLADLSTRLSKTLLNGRPFTFKYQLPNEDLDSLISVSTDEDLENMIDEYDRTNSSLKPSRIRLFLFPSKPESAQSIPPQILDPTARSGEWFFDAINGAVSSLNRGFSDSAASSVNHLLGLDDVAGNNHIEQGSTGEAPDGVSQPGSFGNCKNLKQDVHSVPDSPMMETSSSFGSTSSSPSLANLPPIRVHVEDGGSGGVRVQQQQQLQQQQQDQKVLGIDEQFAQMVVGVGGIGQRLQDEGFAVMSSPPHPPVPTTLAAVGVPIGSAVVVGDYQNRIFSDDERSDHGVPVGYRKPPTPQPQVVQVQPQAQTQTQAQSQAQSQAQTQSQAPQFQQKSSGGGSDLPSPDSVSSDSSLSNAMSRQKPVVYQEQIQIQPGTTRVLSNPVDPKLNLSDSHGRIQVQQHVQDPGYLLQQQFELQQQQQQFELQQQQQQPQHQLQQPQPQHQPQHQPQQPQPQHQPQQQQQLQHHQQQQFIHGGHYIHHNPAIPTYYPVYPSQQQPHHQVYYVPARQPQQGYNISVQQANMGESATTIPSSRPQNPPNPTALVQQNAAYNPIRNAPLPKTEMTAAAYRAATGGSPQFVQVPTSQHQQQYVTYSQIHHPSQSMAPNSAAPASYAYEYADPAQVYYSQPMAPTMPSQYQTMAAATMIQSEVPAQHPSDGMKQQIRTSQPL